MAYRAAAMAGLMAGALALGGCAAAHLAAALGQNFEYQKQIEVLPKYDGLSGHTVAVIVDADMATLYEYPDLATKITSGVTLRLQRDVPEVRVASPDAVVRWQWSTPQWNALPYGQIAESLGVDRVIYIDLYEYRLNPPGNRWLWEGACAANVSVIERDAFDPDVFADTFSVVSNFPTVKGVDRSSATAAQIETGLLTDFVKRATWLFHTHLEPKYPDKYRPEG